MHVWGGWDGGEVLATGRDAGLRWQTGDAAFDWVVLGRQITLGSALVAGISASLVSQVPPRPAPQAPLGSRLGP